MSDPIYRLLLAHPIAKKPYNAIRFSRFDGNGTPLYQIRNIDGACGAMEALKRAFALHGANCFHCGKYYPSGSMGEMTRDHVVPSAAEGSDFLHNLLFACSSCNLVKGKRGLVTFNPEKAEAYLHALNRHMARSLRFEAERLRKAA